MIDKINPLSCISQGSFVCLYAEHFILNYSAIRKRWTAAGVGQHMAQSEAATAEKELKLWHEEAKCAVILHYLYLMLKSKDEQQRPTEQCCVQRPATTREKANNRMCIRH